MRWGSDSGKEETVAEFDSQWMNAWQDEVNNDPTLPLIGKYFTTDLLLGFGDTEYVNTSSVEVARGKLTPFGPPASNPIESCLAS